jgi:excisionase family DNA binding protein
MRGAKLHCQQDQNTANQQSGEHAQGLPALLISIDELAGTLGISKRTAWRLDASGRIPIAVRIGGLKRWRRDEIVAWIADGCPERRNWTWGRRPKTVTGVDRGGSRAK